MDVHIKIGLCVRVREGETYRQRERDVVFHFRPNHSDLSPKNLNLLNYVGRGELKSNFDAAVSDTSHRVKCQFCCNLM